MRFLGPGPNEWRLVRTDQRAIGWILTAYPEMTGLSSDVMSDGVQARKVHFLDFDPTRVSVLSMCPPGHV